MLIILDFEIVRIDVFILDLGIVVLMLTLWSIEDYKLIPYSKAFLSFLTSLLVS